MAHRVRAAPDRLEAYTAATLPAVHRARAAVADYRQAVAAFNASGGGLADLAGPLAGLLDRLEELDRGPAAFAAALRALDREQARLALALRAMGGAWLGGAWQSVAPTVDLRRIDAAARWLRDRLGEAAKLEDVFGGYLRGLPDRLGPTVPVLVARWRRTVVVTDRVIDGVWLRTVTTEEYFRAAVRRVAVGPDLRGLKGLLPWLQRAGTAADVVHSFVAAREQWVQDADRGDLSATERVVRAATEGAARGGGQALLGSGVGALIGAAGATGGAALVVGAVLAGAGMVASPHVDEFADDAAEWVNEAAADDAADALDGVGRGLRAAGEQAANWAGERARDARAGAELAWDRTTEHLEAAADAAARTAERVTAPLRGAHP